jgi:hypothetical protein
MARILAYTTPGRGHLFPLTPILEELRRRGHQVVLRTLAAEVAAMRQRGFDAGPISDRIEAIAHDDWRAGTAAASSACSSTTPGRCGCTTSPRTRARSASRPTTPRCGRSSASR